MNSTSCRIYADYAWISLHSSAGEVTLPSALPETVTAVRASGDTVKIDINKTNSNNRVTVKLGGSSYAGTLVGRRKKDVVKVALNGGTLVETHYDSIFYASNPDDVNVSWTPEVPVEINYQTVDITWTNVIEIRATTGRPNTIKDTALIKSKLVQPFEGDVTLVKRQHNEKEMRERPQRARITESVQESAEISFGSDETDVGTNVEVHKSLGKMRLSPLTRLELSSSPFTYNQIYYVPLGTSSSSGNAEIQLESISPWYIQPATYNLEYGSYNTTYQMPTTRKGEYLRLPVTKSPQVNYTTTVDRKRKKLRSDPDLYEHTLDIEVKVEDSLPNRKKEILYGLPTRGYKLASSFPQLVPELQKPGWIYWKFQTDDQSNFTMFRVVFHSENSYFS